MHQLPTCCLRMHAGRQAATLTTKECTSTASQEAGRGALTVGCCACMQTQHRHLVLLLGLHSRPPLNALVLFLVVSQQATQDTPHDTHPDHQTHTHTHTCTHRCCLALCSRQATRNTSRCAAEAPCLCPVSRAQQQFPGSTKPARQSNKPPIIPVGPCPHAMHPYHTAPVPDPSPTPAAHARPLEPCTLATSAAMAARSA